MKIPVSRKIIKPERCVIAFGVPTSEEGFYADLGKPKKGFAKKFQKHAGRKKDPYKSAEKIMWEEYARQFASNVAAVVPMLRNLGVHIIHNLTVREFGKLFQNGKYDVIILFSHWREEPDEAVEFYDDFADVSTMLSHIPNDFDRIIDLCVCQPESLATRLNLERPDCLIRYNQKEVLPYVWLYFYQILFKHLKEYDLRYGRACNEVTKAFFNKERCIMKRLNAMFKKYLKNIGAIGFETFGGNDEQGGETKISEEASQTFTAELNAHQKFNNNMVRIMIAMLCALFVVGMLLVFHFRDNPAMMGAVFGGDFLGLLVIVAWLRQLWFERFIISEVKIVRQNLSPEQAAKFILLIYKEGLQKSKEPSSS